MPGLRGTLKNLAERVLAASPLLRLARKHRAGQCVILAFHNIVPSRQPTLGDRPLHLPLDDFERFLDALIATHAVVGLDHLEAPAADGRPRAAITFDDAYAGALRYGLPALVARNLPVTIFVAPGLLGRRACWWDRWSDPETGLNPQFRQTALQRFDGDDDAIARWALATSHAPGSSHEGCQIATEDELRSIASGPGVTLGAHSWKHQVLTAIGPEELRAEMEQPLAWLRERFSTARPWVAYPYGLTSAEVRRAAERAGYTLGFRVSGGWVASVPDHRWDLPRWSVPYGVTKRGFVLRTAGVVDD